MSKATSEAARPITDRIKTMADVFAFQGTTAEQFSAAYSGLPDDVIAYLELRLLTNTLNEGEELKTADTDQWKYFPWFEVVPNSETPAGFGLSYGVCAYSLTNADIGARLALKSVKLAEYAGKQFHGLYQRFFS